LLQDCGEASGEGRGREKEAWGQGAAQPLLIEGATEEVLQLNKLYS
jgi:hypothetical protein